MGALIYAILTCTPSACLANPTLPTFQSAQACYKMALSLVERGTRDDKHYRVHPFGNPNVWFECDQKPVSEWQPAEPPAPDTSSAKPFEHVAYALLRCVGSVC